MAPPRTEAGKQSPRVPSLDRYFSVMITQGLYTRERNLRNHVNAVFHDFEFRQKRVLEIGGGNGLLSFYAASGGAAEVVCLEPQAAGSTSGSNLSFDEIKAQLGLTNVFLEKVTLQQFQPGNKTFDLIVLHNSINHLDENACIHLLKDEAAKNTYRAIFRQLRVLANRGAGLIVSDCSPYNLFALLRLKNPFAPSIEWHKHQAPEIWAALLAEQGFGRPSIHWTSYNSLGSFGRLLFGNRFISFLWVSHFRLEMTTN
jgi:SAM-dependent methyltransferase